MSNIIKRLRHTGLILLGLFKSSVPGLELAKNLETAGVPGLVCRRFKLDVELAADRFPAELLANPADKGVADFFFASVFFWNS
jgi:hypothetical protein